MRQRAEAADEVTPHVTEDAPGRRVGVVTGEGVLVRQGLGRTQPGALLQVAARVGRQPVQPGRELQERTRLRSTEPLPDEDAVAGDDLDPANWSILGDVRRDLVRGLGSLSHDQRSAVVLRDVMGLSYEDVARAASMPVGTAKSYVHRGRKRLRTALEDPIGSRAATGPASLP